MFEWHDYMVDYVIRKSIGLSRLAIVNGWPYWMAIPPLEYQRDCYGASLYIKAVNSVLSHWRSVY